MDTSRNSSQFLRGREFYSKITLSITGFDVFQFSSMEMGAPPLRLTEMYPGPHATLITYSCQNPHTFLRHPISAELFLWVTPHFQKPAGSKTAFSVKALGRQAEPFTPSPLSIWCFSQWAQRGLPRRTWKRKRKEKKCPWWVGGGAFLTVQAHRKLVSFHREPANLSFVHWLLEQQGLLSTKPHTVLVPRQCYGSANSLAGVGLLSCPSISILTNWAYSCWGQLWHCSHIGLWNKESKIISAIVGGIASRQWVTCHCGA